MTTIQANYHAEMLELPSRNGENDIFSPAIWRALAAEYLVQLGAGLSVAARRDSLELAEEVSRLVEPRAGFGGMRYHVYGNGRLQESTSTWSPVADANPYDSFASMVSAHGVSPSGMLVSSLFADSHPTSPGSMTLAFRAWHDDEHLAHGLGFSPNDEVALFAIQAQRLSSIRAGAARALFSESVYQLAAQVTLGDYPATQTVAELGPVGREVFDRLVWGAAQHSA